MKSVIWKLISAFLAFFLLEKVEGICFNETSTNIVSFNSIIFCFSRQIL